MSKLVVSLGIGAIAGVLDVIPMVVQKLDKYACCSAFVHWLVLGVIIAHIRLPLAPWLQGLVVAEMCALPIVLLVMKDDPQSILPILVMSALLGIGVGLAANRYAV